LVTETKSDKAERSCRGSYGIDAPWLIPILGLLIAVNLLNGILSKSYWPFLAVAVILGFAGFGLYASRRGKFVVWTELIKGLHLRGDERILDLGCGRGAILIIAAKSLKTGKAIGIDIWNRRDQSSNSLDATVRNAMVEGVSDRVEIRTADMTELPFEDNYFDLVLSNLAIHNVKGELRSRAIEEAVRVLTPGGRFMIADIMGVAEYEKVLRKIGITTTTRRDLGWRMWWSGPWARTILVSCTKPTQGDSVDKYLQR